TFDTRRFSATSAHSGPMQHAVLPSAYMVDRLSDVMMFSQGSDAGFVGGRSPFLVRLCTGFFFSSRRRHTRCYRDWSSDVCSSDLLLSSQHALKQPAEPMPESSCPKQLGGRQYGVLLQRML